VSYMAVQIIRSCFVDPGNGKWGRRLDRVEDGRQGSSRAAAGQQ
jgi:hypothetical protein